MRRDALRAEWTKLRTSPGTGWLLAAVAALTAGVGLAASAAARCPGLGCPADPVKTSLTGILLGQAVVAVLAVLVIGGEYSTGMIHVTFTALPGRVGVLAAKATVLSGLTAAAGAVGVGGSVLAARLVMPGHGIAAPSLGDGPVLRAAAGSVLYLVLIVLLSLGTATAVRDPAIGIGAVLGLLYLFPIVTSAVTDAPLRRHLQQLAPMSAGLAIQATTDLRHLPIGPWAGLGVLAAWAGAVLAGAALLLRVRDA